MGTQPIKNSPIVQGFLFGHGGLEFSTLYHFLDDVQTTQQLSTDVQLWVSWPVRVGLQSCHRQRVDNKTEIREVKFFIFVCQDAETEKEKKRKVEGKRYEASSRVRSSLNTLAF